MRENFPKHDLTRRAVCPDLVPLAKIFDADGYVGHR